MTAPAPDSTRIATPAKENSLAFRSRGLGCIVGIAAVATVLPELGTPMSRMLDVPDAARKGGERGDRRAWAEGTALSASGPVRTEVAMVRIGEGWTAGFPMLVAVGTRARPASVVVSTGPVPGHTTPSGVRTP